MAAELVVVKGEHRGEFVQITGSVTIGRSNSAELILRNDTKVSSKHARVFPTGDRFLLEDLNSTNGTFVNQEQIEQIPLRSGDLIRIGRSLIVFRADGSRVRLEDVALVGGGSTAGIGRRKVEGVLDQSDASIEAVSDALAAQLSSASGPNLGALIQLIAASAAPTPREGLERVLASVRSSCGAGRILLFLRHTHTGGLGCAMALHGEGVGRALPVDPELLARAANGEGWGTPLAAAAPVLIRGIACGVLLVDACTGPPPLEVVTTGGVLIGLLVGLDRSRRLAASASEIVTLAQAQVQKRALDLGAQIKAAERLYAAAAAHRGLRWDLELPAGLLVSADPILLGRGLDKLVEHVLAEAHQRIHIAARHQGETIGVIVRHDTSEPPEVFSGLLHPDGVAADLRRAGETFGDGLLAVARACLLRAGGRFALQPDSSFVSFRLDLEPASPSQGL